MFMTSIFDVINTINLDVYDVEFDVINTINLDVYDVEYRRHKHDQLRCVYDVEYRRHKHLS